MDSAKLTFLIIDDEVEIIDIIEDYIASIAPNARILRAQNGLEGLILAREYQPDYMIVDLHMPVMSGGDMLRRLEIPTTDHRVIICSGHPVKIAELNNQFPTVEKPFGMQDLKNALTNIMQHGKGNH